MFGLSRIAYAVLALAALANADYPSPGSCSGDCWAHDPALIIRESDGEYFRFNTGTEIGIWKASSLEGEWVYQGAVLPDGSSIDLDGNTDLWAPDVHHMDGKYVLFYAVSTSGSQDSAIGYATSKTMEYGSWTDHGSTGVASSSSKIYNAIDPNLIKADSTYYMNFGSFWDDLYQVEMKSSGVKTAGSSAYNIAYQPSGTHPQEGAFMYQRDGYYYLFWSEGICCNYDSSMPASGAEYKVRVCRSTSVSGPFEDQDGTSCTDGGGTTVLASHGLVYGPGGQGIIADPDHGTVIYYHYADTSIGYADSDYQFGWNVISWSTGWPVLSS